MKRRKHNRDRGSIDRPGRYGNVRKHVHQDGTKLDSGRELKRYAELLLLQRAGEICGLTVHPRFPITIAGTPILLKSSRYPNGRHLTYVADFSYFPGKVEDCKLGMVIEDVKMQSGHRTEIYKIKRALMDAMGKPITEY
jgi:hypothetical protein